MVEIASCGARVPRGKAPSNGARGAPEHDISNGAALSLGAGVSGGARISNGAGGPTTAGTPPEQPSRRTSRSSLLTLLDALALALALIVANHLMVRGAVITLPDDTRLTYPQLSVLLGTVWLIALDVCRGAARFPRSYWRTEFRHMARASFIALGTLSMAAVVLPLDIDRPFVAAVFTGGLSLQLVSRWLIRWAAIWRLDHAAHMAGRCRGPATRG